MNLPTRPAAARGRARGVAARLAVTAVLAGLLGGACRPGTVSIAYRPEVGSTAVYDVEVTSRVVTDLDGTTVDTDRVDLVAEHDVVESGADGSRVRVRLRAGAGGAGPRTFLVRLDRAAQLTEVQEVEGVPAAVLGELSLSEIFPAAAGAPPEGPLRPGQRWSVDEPLGLPGLQPARLTGRGRLVSLASGGGVESATVETSLELPVRRRTEVGGSRIRLAGVQRTAATTVYDLVDGSVVRAESVTTATLELEAAPPADAPGDPARGTLRVEVRSTTVRR